MNWGFGLVDTTNQFGPKTSGTGHLQRWRSHLHPCSSDAGSVSFCSQSHSPPGRRRCRGRRPYLQAPLQSSLRGGSAPALSACASGGSWLEGTPPEGNHSRSEYCCVSELKIPATYREMNDETSFLKRSPVHRHPFTAHTLCVSGFDQLTCGWEKKRSSVQKILKQASSFGWGWITGRGDSRTLCSDGSEHQQLISETV